MKTRYRCRKCGATSRQERFRCHCTAAAEHVRPRGADSTVYADAVPFTQYETGAAHSSPEYASHSAGGESGGGGASSSWGDSSSADSGSSGGDGGGGGGGGGD